jgi:hypothetical protein
MMGHTQEEQWHVKREEYRKKVADYYKAKRIARMIQVELGIGNLPNVDPWKFKNAGMREMVQLLRRSMNSLASDKLVLGLANDTSIKPHDWENRVMRRSRDRTDGPNVVRRIMSVEEAAEEITKALDRHPDGAFTFPKFYEQLVIKKGIYAVFGSTKFVVNRMKDLSINYSGGLIVCAAREIKAEWVTEENMRAFKVAIIPADYSGNVYDCVIGYAAISTLTSSIKPAFGKDIASAVSLCKRRVRVEVLKRMEA